MSLSSRPSRLFRSFRPLAVAMAAATVGSLAAGISPAASATGPSVILSQDVAARSPGEFHTVTATVTGADGQPAADGTPLTFTISGPTGAISTGAPVVGLALHSAGAGGWLVRSDGHVDGFGADSPVEAPAPVNSPAVDLAATPTGNGYWITTAAGHVRVAGDAVSYGDLGNVTLNGPILRMTPAVSAVFASP